MLTGAGLESDGIGVVMPGCDSERFISHERCSGAISFFTAVGLVATEQLMLSLLL